ncbi:MAG: hypothetical protein ACE5NM_06805 [Sedimentisphaerales bacterium]
MDGLVGRWDFDDGTGIENPVEKIRQILGVVDFDLKTVVCFADRQEKLLKHLQDTKSNATLRSTSPRSTRQQAASITAELLNGQV